MTRRPILLILLLMLGLTAYAEAQVPVIVQLSPSGNITSVVSALNGILLDNIPGTKIYLLNLPIPVPSALNSLLSPLENLLLGIQ